MIRLADGSAARASEEAWRASAAQDGPRASAAQPQGRARAVGREPAVSVRDGAGAARAEQSWTFGGSPYEGDYEADARFSEQVFPTRSRLMRDDFTVRAINYTEAPNDFGTTLTIGG